MLYANLPAARTYVYKDTLKLPLGKISWIITAVKAIDIMTGFLVGKMSDNTRTKWGRRKPYIVVAWPIGMLCILLFVGAEKFVFPVTPPSNPCENITVGGDGYKSTFTYGSNDTCNDALKACYADKIAQGLLLPPDSPYTLPNNETSSKADPGIESYLFLLYLGHFTFIVSGSQIPYDALGQGLTDDYDERAKLFTWKPVFNLVGAIIGSQLFGFMGEAYKTDTSKASLYTFLMMMVFNVIGYFLLLFGVKEKALKPPDAAQKQLPLTVAFRRLLNVKQYRMYLLMRIPMTMLSLLPFFQLIFFYQNNMEMETIVTHDARSRLIAIVGAFISIPLQTWLAGKYGRRKVLTVMLAMLGAIFVVAFFIPFNKSPNLIYLLGPFLGVCIVAPVVIPDAMLGDIIDYDELLTGERNEAMYSMVETNMQQFIELLLSVSMMLMDAAGFNNLSGCECGCGVSCPGRVGMPMRWVCPGSIGYSCDDEVESTLFFQPEPNGVPPCAVQNDGVKFVTSLFMFGIPGIAGLLAIFPIRHAIIEKDKHQEIIAGIKTLREKPNAVVNDPITGKPVVRPVNSEASLFAEHFSEWEWGLAKRGVALSQLKCYLGARLSGYVGLFIIFIIINNFVDSDALLQASFWVLAFLIVMVPYDLLRYGRTSYPPSVTP